MTERASLAIDRMCHPFVSRQSEEKDMRITVTSSIDGIVAGIATQFVDADVASKASIDRRGIVDAGLASEGSVGLTGLIDASTLLRPFADQSEECLKSLKARLVVFSVPAMSYTLRGDQTEAENSHVIMPSGMPRTMLSADDVSGRVVATFRVDDVAPIRHEIDADLIAKAIDDQIANLLRERAEILEEAPKDANASISSINRRIAQERDVYAKVRIVELCGTHAPERPFHIVYGDEPDDATGVTTGGFETLEKAQGWFTNQGR
jgi:chorismate mutase